METLERLPLRSGGVSAFLHLPLVRGYCETMQLAKPDTLDVRGWMLLPDEPLDAIDVYLGTENRGKIELMPREDIRTAFPWLKHTENASFVIPLNIAKGQENRTHRLDLVALYKGEPRGRLSQWVRSDVDTLPTAPDEFIFRVAHANSPHFFKVGGLKTVGDVLELLARHADLKEIRHVLDWGCGCGRVAMYLQSIQDGPEVLGCDIDPQTVKWCNKNLGARRFSVLRPMPPAPYKAGSFDFIYSYSVFTHLARDVQHAWLAEMYRLLRPGGYFIATTHGQFALQFAMASLDAQFPSEGIIDSHLDPTLDSVAPKNYYRATYQAKEYTLREFGEYFDILEYLERGATNFQDIVVMRKSAAGGASRVKF